MSPYRVYCRVVAVVFFMITLYTVVVKLAQQRLAEDWFHSVLHVLSGTLAAIAGWLVPDPRIPRLFVIGLGAVYFALGLFGWFVPGLLLGTPLAIPLGPADNIFHLLLSIPALIIVVSDRLHSRRAARMSSGQS